MSDETALTVTESAPKPPALLEMEPDAMIARASSIAGALVGVIERQKMYAIISQRKFVTCEGWTTLGAMLGILPRETEVTETPDGWAAHVDLIKFSTGQVVGGASAICSRSEKTWASRDNYAVRSMAVTRATGKAYRISFGWIMKLAGYEPTPKEEMPDDMIDPPKSQAVKAEPVIEDICEVCSTPLQLSKNGKNYICKNWADKSKGNHTIKAVNNA